MQQNLKFPPNLKKASSCPCVPTCPPWNCCLLDTLHFRETFCSFGHVPFLVAWSCPLPRFVSLWGEASWILPNWAGFLLQSAGILHYKRALGSFVCLLGTLSSFSSLGVPKEMHCFFPQAGNPLRQDPTVSIFCISPNSPISFSAHRWHSTHVERLSQKVFPPCSEPGCLFQVYIQMYMKGTWDSVSMYHRGCRNPWYILWNAFEMLQCQSPFTKSVHNKVTFVCLINAAPDQNSALEIAGASEDVTKSMSKLFK